MPRLQAPLYTMRPQAHSLTCSTLRSRLLLPPPALASGITRFTISLSAQWLTPTSAYWRPLISSAFRRITRDLQVEVISRSHITVLPRHSMRPQAPPLLLLRRRTFLYAAPSGALPLLTFLRRGIPKRHFSELSRFASPGAQATLLPPTALASGITGDLPYVPLSHTAWS